MRWYHWLWLGVIVAVATVGWTLGRGRRPEEVLESELAVADARREARQAEIEHGVEIARDRVLREHAATMEALDEKQSQKAAMLMGDPAALSAMLTRLGGREVQGD